VKASVPGIKGYQDFRRLLDDATSDAVLIATPQHQHALNSVPAVQAGKDVDQDGFWCAALRLNVGWPALVFRLAVVVVCG
jgi:hypothetical protein